MDIGSSTPKKRKAKSPLKGVLKVRSLSDDEAPHNENLNVANVMFSTPVSSQKPQRGSLLKLKNTRFVLPTSADVARNKSTECIASRYMKHNVSIKYKLDLVVNRVNYILHRNQQCHQ